jgi:hypothetical protein
MATKKTAQFTLTERLTMGTAGSLASATIDLASYIDVADRQAISIQSVDFIVQGTTASETLTAMTGGGDSDIQVQVLDLNREGLVFVNDRALVASMRYNYDGGGSSYFADVYPDNFGPHGSAAGRIVVNDTLYVEGITSTLGTDKACNVTVRINATVVSLNAKDFMAIAIQSTAADN